MKRSAIVLGPTPPFLRWCIKRSCDFRQCDETSATLLARFRGLHEVSAAYGAGRVVDNMCLHPNNRRDSLDQAKGFRVEEVTVMFGGPEKLESTCGPCPANAPWEPARSGASPSWAGCTGWLARIFDGESICALWTRVIGEALSGQDEERLFLRTDPAWFGFWSREHWRIEDGTLETLARVVRRVDASLWSDHRGQRDWLHFQSAVQRCLDHGLELRSELVPAGDSDGSRWELLEHCPRCKARMTREQRYCPTCRRQGGPHPRQIRKVLGERPFGKLIWIVGPQRTEELVRRQCESQSARDEL